MISRSDLKDLAVLFRQFGRNYWASLGLLSVVSAAAAFLTAAAPLVLAPALDAALVADTRAASSIGQLTLNNLGATLLAVLRLTRDTSRLRILVTVGLVYLGVVALAAGLNFAALQLMRWIRTGIANDLQSALFRHMLGLSLRFFVPQRVGELTNRFIYDVVSTAQSFDPLMKGLFESALQILFYGFILLRTDALLAAAVGVVALLHLGITRGLQEQIKKRTADTLNSYAEVSSLVQEAFVGIRIVKVFSAERFEMVRLEGLLNRLKRVILSFGFYSNSESPLRDVANALAVVTALVVSFAALAAGRLTLPGLVLFVVVTRQAIVPFAQLSAALVQLQGIIGASQRVREILETPPVVVDGPREAEAFRDAIVLRGVSFSHDPEVPVLQGVSLEIRRGQVVALVGPSGAGKSTLADLVLRLIDPNQGVITYDGTDLRQFRQASYRSKFGVVSQEALLFNTTIEENIAYGRPLVRGDVDRAARLANAEEFILKMPDGYRTLVGDRGIRLSGGQRQRIAIARAVYGRPDILILDEATSALDSESELQVQAAIDRSVATATALLIAHRLSTVRRAHTIVVLSEGRVEAMGSHQELLKGSPLYRRLCSLQLGDATAEMQPR